MTSLAPEFNRSLPRAVATADLQKARDLLRDGADVNDRDNAHGWTGLMWAALLHRADFANLLLDHGADINLQSPENGFTALIFAAYHGETAMARLLVERGADVNIKNNLGLTAQEVAQQNGRADVVNYLQDLIDDRRRQQNFQRLREQTAKRKMKLGPGL